MLERSIQADAGRTASGDRGSAGEGRLSMTSHNKCRSNTDGSSPPNLGCRYGGPPGEALFIALGTRAFDVLALRSLLDTAPYGRGVLCLGECTGPCSLGRRAFLPAKGGNAGFGACTLS